MSIDRHFFVPASYGQFFHIKSNFSVTSCSNYLIQVKPFLILFYICLLSGERIDDSLIIKIQPSNLNWCERNYKILKYLEYVSLDRERQILILDYTFFFYMQLHFASRARSCLMITTIFTLKVA